MRRIISFIISFAMLCTTSVSAKTLTNNVSNEIYKVTFENGIPSDLSFNLSTEITEDGFRGGKALKVAADGTGRNLETTLKRLQKKCLSEVSVWVKPAENGGNVSFQLIVYVSANGKERSFILGKATSNGEYVQLESRIDTRFLNPDASIRIGISAEKEGVSTGFLLDDFIVLSDSVAVESAVKAVAELKYEGNLLKRASFETGTFDMFGLSPSCDFEITDEYGAHTGKYAMRCCNRTASWHVARAYLYDVDPKSTVTMSCWVKKDAKSANVNFRIQSVVKDSGKDVYEWLTSSTTVVDDEWHYLEGSLDLSKYKEIESVGLLISTGDHSFPDYYVDDFMIRSNKPGEFYDDMDYVKPERKPGYSNSPAKQDPFVIPVQQDIPSLKDVYKDYFKIGGNSYSMAGAVLGEHESRANEVFVKHFNTLVSNGYFKMPEILTKGNRTDYDFRNADWLMEFAHKNGIEEVTGHALFWEVSMSKPYTVDENGDYLDRDGILAFMKEYATKVVKHFEGDGDPLEYQPGVDYSDWHIGAWDVVNEAILEGEDNWRQSAGFYNVLGKDYVKYAFKFVDDLGYDDIQLRYNDWGETWSGKRRANDVFHKWLINEKVPVDIIGMQGHYPLGMPIQYIRDAFEVYSSYGINLDITEFDISAYTGNQINAKVQLYEDGLPNDIEISQADMYYQAFEIYKEYADIIDRVVFWTVFDGISHLNSSAGFKRTDYGGLFDRNYQAKPQFWAIADPAYYFKNCLKEDTSRTRIFADGVQLELAENELFERNGATYCEATKLLDGLGIKYVKSGDVYAMIVDGVYMELGAGKNQIKKFKDYTMETEIIVENDMMFLPVIDVGNMLGISASYNEYRNLINIANEADISSVAEADVQS